VPEARTVIRPLIAPVWNLEHLQSHLQGVIDLELWTIPYYMAAMYSIRDPATREYQALQDVVHQEMFHVQLVSNVANSFGLQPTFTAPVYGTAVPHVDFSLDQPNPTSTYTPFSAAIGPLDADRVNTMCLVEYPQWNTQRQPDLRPDISQYGSIAEFYAAVREGMYQFRHTTLGGINQIDEFRLFYNELQDQTVTLDNVDGYRQAITLIQVIIDQGEGESQGDTAVAPHHRNTADGFDESWSHFKKFTRIRGERAFPETYHAVADPPAGSAGAEAQARLVRDFGTFLDILTAMFGGRDYSDFGPVMAKLGAAILSCWQRGAIPRFS
jgi:hypothetical protein